MSAPYYADESVTLYWGDCREVPEWLVANVLVTDPPYGMAYTTGWTGESVIGDRDVSARDAALRVWGNRPAVVFGRWSVTRPSATRVLLTWDKGEWPGMGDLSLPWGPSSEEIYILGSGFQGKRSGTVLRFNRRPVCKVDHPTTKPVALMETLLAKCPPGTIADPFAGSGSTLLAARAQGRRSIGVEIEERYCEVIAKRLAQADLFGGAA